MAYFPETYWHEREDTMRTVMCQVRHAEAYCRLADCGKHDAFVPSTKLKQKLATLSFEVVE
jgi:hypothetical protein